MDKDQLIAKAVGTAVGLFPNEISYLLTTHGIVIFGRTNEQLVESVYSGLHNSEGFNKAFTEFLSENAEALRKA